MSAPRERLAAAVNQAPLFLGLVALWMLLWGRFGWLELLSGVLVGALVSVTFYLPAVQLSGRLNPWHGARFFLRLLADIVRASVQVAALALSPRYRPGNAILAIGLNTRSDLILTWTAVATSIVPGSIVVDSDRVSSTLYLHVLNVHSADQAERFRASVLATERRIVLAFGSREDVERIRACPAGADATLANSEGA